jgi:formylmethanofuran dehydrogenase subunit E
MSKKLKIEGVADFSSIAKEAKTISKTIEGAFGRNGLQVFDKSSITFIKAEADKTFSKMRESLSRMSDEARKIDDSLKNSVLSDEERTDLTKRRWEYTSKMHAAEREMFQLRGSVNSVKNGGVSTIGTIVF